VQGSSGTTFRLAAAAVTAGSPNATNGTLVG
jgi:hypothetical protein